MAATRCAAIVPDPTLAADPDDAAPLLLLDPIGDTHFRARHNLNNGRDAIFGGQPIAQGLAAAMRTVPGWPAHSATAQYLRAGRVEVPVDYQVEATRDGRRYASRRVIARQDGVPIFDMLCSFHDPEPGPHHRLGRAPALPAPETLEPMADVVRRNAHRLPPLMVATYLRRFPVEHRLPDPEHTLFARPLPPHTAFWLRVASAAAVADPGGQQCLLAFLSDFWLAGVVGSPHVRTAETDRVATVTVNHSIWFHAPVRVEDWLLYDTDSPWADDGRGLARGLIYDRHGRLAASTAQEISMRRF